MMTTPSASGTWARTRVGAIEAREPYVLRVATPADVDLLYAIHSMAMRSYVIATWGNWDDAWQTAYFSDHFPPDRQVIEVGGEAAGFLDLERRDDCYFVANVELSPQHQRHGTGTALLGQVIERAASEGLPVALQVLKVNPARRLYERLGFRLTGETDTHFLMRTGDPD